MKLLLSLCFMFCSGIALTKGIDCPQIDKYLGTYKGACVNHQVLFHYVRVSPDRVQPFEGTLIISREDFSCNYSIKTIGPSTVSGFKIIQGKHLFHDYKDVEVFTNNNGVDEQSFELDIIKRDGFNFSQIHSFSDTNPLLYTIVINTVLDVLHPYDNGLNKSFALRIDTSSNDNSGAQYNHKVICNELKRVN